MVAHSRLADIKNDTPLRPVRVMIVDDSLTVRCAFSRQIESEADLQVVGTFNCAELAIASVRPASPDVIILDLEMPGMGGLKALPLLLSSQPGVQILVVSAYTQKGTEQTIHALAMGAADTMPKPKSGEAMQDYCEQLLTNIRALGLRRVLRRAGRLPSKPHNRRAISVSKIDAVGIGASTGGIHALCALLRALPPKFDKPIFVTQHLPTSFMPVFAEQLEKAAARRVALAHSGMSVQKGEIILAPGDGHLNIHSSANGLSVQISDEQSVTGCRPSIDPMLKSLALATQGKAAGIILSGMGTDGVIGARNLADAGGTIIAQDEQSSVVWGMPQAVAVRGLTSAILPPADIARHIGSMG